jgi:peptide/nickel transport system substrate-binding protein
MIALGCAAPALIATRPARSAAKVLKVVLAVDMRGIDPVFNTAAYAAYHGYLVYDQLFALDSRGKPQPQMVDSWQVSDNRKAWMFRLRTGLKFHDGSPVRAADAVASILRWKDRDVVGKALFSAGAKLEVVDDLIFTLALRDSFGLVLDALAKPLSNALFVMPEAVAKTPASAQISSAVGSGPFIFVKEEWRPGSQAVYVRNPDYVPRKEKPDGLAGGKVVKVDRVEWLSMPDPTTAISALGAGEIDYLQNPAMDTYPVLKANPKVRFVTVDPTGSMVWIRPNHLQPPFDNPKARLALLHTVDQTAILQAIGAPAENARPFCGSFFMCGTPLETKAAGPREGQGAAAGVGLRRPACRLHAAERSCRQLQRHGRGRRGHAQGGLQGRHPAAGLGNAVAAPQQQGPGRRQQQGRLEPVHHRRHGA